MATSSLRSKIGSALAIVLPKRSNPEGTVPTPTYNPSSPDAVLTVPTYRDHLIDLFDTRAAQDSRSLIKSLLQSDPDMSAALNAFLVAADTKPLMVVKDINDQIDRPGQLILNEVLMSLTQRNDYSKGFQIKSSMSALTEACRYMLLLRGALGGELILSKEFFATELRLVDMAKIEWYEKQANVFSPTYVSESGQRIPLEIPTFFTTWFRKDPTTIYSTSPFVSAINTIAARTQVINDLYRIMKVTGYPRMDVTVLEEVLIKNMPSQYQTDPEQRATYLQGKLTEITTAISSIRPDQAFVHYNSVTADMMNEKSSGMTLNIDSIITTLNAQNQAGLKTMATILGRGESGVNTASVEARVFSMSAQSLNNPIADLLSQALTLAIRLRGSQSYVDVKFKAVELRPDTELEPMLAIRRAGLRQDLSDGLITDDEYHLAMYDRLAPEGTPLLSGTGFMNKSDSTVDPTEISPNSDPLGQSIAVPGGQKASKDNKNKPK